MGQLQSVFNFLSELGLKDAASALAKDAKLDKAAAKGIKIDSLKDLFASKEKR